MWCFGSGFIFQKSGRGSRHWNEGKSLSSETQHSWKLAGYKETEKCHWEKWSRQDDARDMTKSLGETVTQLTGVKPVNGTAGKNGEVRQSL